MIVSLGAADQYKVTDNKLLRRNLQYATTSRQSYQHYQPSTELQSTYCILLYITYKTDADHNKLVYRITSYKPDTKTFLSYFSAPFPKITLSCRWTPSSAFLSWHTILLCRHVHKTLRESVSTTYYKNINHDVTTHYTTTHLANRLRKLVNFGLVERKNIRNTQPTITLTSLRACHYHQLDTPRHKSTSLNATDLRSL